MAKTVLVINSGSSSIKYQLVDLESGEGLASSSRRSVSRSTATTSTSTTAKSTSLKSRFTTTSRV